MSPGPSAGPGSGRWRRPDSHSGRLMTATGFGVFVFPLLSQVDAPLALTAGLLFASVWTIAFAAVVLTFGSRGRLATTADRVLVSGVGRGPLVVLGFGGLLALHAPFGPPALVCLAAAAHLIERRRR